MEKQLATTSLELDKRRIKKDGSYPLKLMVIYKRRFRRYKTKYSFTEDEFSEIFEEKRRKHKDIRLKVLAQEEKAIKAIKKLRTFNFDLFENEYLHGSNGNEDIYNNFDKYIDQLEREERLKTAESYESARNSFKKYRKFDRLYHEDVTVEYLKKYEAWMAKQGKSITTTAIYLRCMRHIYNRTVEKLDVSKSSYPFGKGKYEIPSAKNTKKSLTLKDIKKIYEFEPRTKSEALYRDIWMLSYFCNGMNIKDICLLKYKDLQEDRIVFYRAKTQHNKASLKQITIPLINESKAILEKYRNKNKIKPEHQVFSFLTNPKDARKVKADVAQVTKQVNHYIKAVKNAVEIKMHVTSYSARHSFATILKRSGVNVTYISDALGHSSISTTESYLDSFEDDQRNEITGKLVDW